MLNKTWTELYEMDISADLDTNTTQKDKNGNHLKYLSWNKCLYLLHKHGAEDVRFEPIYNSENGHSVFTFQHAAMIEKMDSKRVFDPYAPEVHVRVIVDDKQGEYSYPLINGIEVIPMGKVNQQLVNSARQRAFVKGVAILTGLGLKLWEKEDSEEKEKEKSYIDSIMELYAIAVKKCGDESSLAKKINLSGSQLKSVMNTLKYIPSFERNLRGIR